SAVTPTPDCGWQTVDPVTNPNGSSCTNNKCCNDLGYCGNNNDCMDGCQWDFGRCEDPICGVEVPTDQNNMVCGQPNECCSGEGFCGNDDDACGIGCQYGDCDPPIPWYPLPASPPNYTSGACMREVFNHFFDKTDHHPVCRAKEVHSFMATLL
ncbi:hypothetical protein ACHAW6_001851, partial [Cyclotella cf. meneghiniana]